MFYQVMQNYRIHSGSVFSDMHTPLQVTTVVIESVQLVLSQLKKLFNVVN